MSIPGSTPDPATTTEWPASNPVTTSPTTSTCSLGTRERFMLSGDQILCKVSHVNDALKEFQTAIFDDDVEEECHFLRIIRIGPRVTNKESTLPGALIVAHQKSGMFLENLSQDYGEKYYLLLESDIRTYIDL